MTMRSFSYILLLSVLLLLNTQINAQTTSFTYQGKITDSSVTQPTNGSYDMQFRLWDNPSAGQGTQQGSTVSNLGVPVTGSIFTVNLDFGSAVFAAGANLYLEISIRTAGSQGGYTSLGPRQRFTSVPYAIQSLKATNATTADTATDSNQLGGIAANQYVLSEDPRLTDSRNPLSGSSNYIQNGTTTQATSNFSISGNGTAGGTLSGNVVNATTQFNIGASRVLSTPFTSNLFVGTSTGASNTVGTSNTLIGSGANVAANNLTFATALGAGSVASANNTVTLGRALDTVMVPGSLTIGGTFTANIFNAVTQFNIGGNRMLSSPGTNNVFAGNAAGTANSTGQANSYFGFNAGNDNTTGSFNAFFGSNAGAANTTAINNSFFGQGAGFRNTTASDNTFLGNGAGLNTTTGPGNTFVGSLAGQGTIGGSNNSFLGINAGKSNIGSSNNTFIGANSANSVLTGSGNTYLGTGTDGATVTSNSTAIGFNAYAGQSNAVILGSVNGINGATVTTDVGIGTSTPASRLHVVGDTSLIGKVGVGTSAPTYRFHVLNNTDQSMLIESNSAKGAGIELKSNRSTVHNWAIYTGDNQNFGYNLFFLDKTVNQVVMSLRGDSSGGGVVNVDGLVAKSIFMDFPPADGDEPLCLNSSIGRITACSNFHKSTPALTKEVERINTELVKSVKEQKSQIEAMQKQLDELKAALANQKSAVNTPRISKGKKHDK